MQYTTTIDFIIFYVCKGNIELFCKLYQPQGDMIKHMTPFTTWLIQRDPGWTFINFDDVTSVELTLMGHFRNSIKVQDQEGIKASYISDVLDDDKVCEPTKHIKYKRYD